MPRLPHGLNFARQQVRTAVVSKSGNDIDADVWSMREFDGANLESRHVVEQLRDCKGSFALQVLSLSIVFSTFAENDISVEIIQEYFTKIDNFNN
ncbi:hypothetical protein LJD47_27050, partial [Escherichia coli]|nr:hypothetical protein [Escherichia coli]